MKWSKCSVNAGSIEAAVAAVELRIMRHVKDMAAKGSRVSYPKKGAPGVLAKRVEGQKFSLSQPHSTHVTS